MKPTLMILAAGMGSRYGGLKQLDQLGPSGETIMDYSVYDAIRAGFGKIVFVIRRDFEDEFREKVISKYKNHISIEVVFQSLEALPQGFTKPEGRTKPWGTNHAIMMGAKVINEPFAVINADDFYGKESFAVLSNALQKMVGTKDDYCMVGYRLGNTLSESGHVSRGVCSMNEKRCLTTVVEHYEIQRRDGKVTYKSGENQYSEIDENLPVSMNMRGFTPDYFVHSEKDFIQFLTEHGTEEKSEYGIPTMVNKLIKTATAQVRVLDTPDSWFGVTYKEDRPTVVSKIAALVEQGVYPKQLFK